MLTTVGLAFSTARTTGPRRLASWAKTENERRKKNEDKKTNL
jgi:hypothetical protein